MCATRAFGFVLAAILLVSTGTTSGQTPIGTAFTYQGQLKYNDSAVNDTCDFEFGLWDEPSDGSQVATTLTVDAIEVAEGLFTVALDFGEGAFQGDARWLAMAVCCPSPSCTPLPLDGRQKLTPAPHTSALPGLRTEQNATSPNLLGGHSGNMIEAGVDVHIPIADGRELAVPPYAEPEAQQGIILEKLNLKLPKQPPPRIRSGEVLMPTDPPT
ncbi:MAG: hypothetical protein JSU86_05405 [Phycisphaerales bacterium]|nr:MAG: hypothetical protein JSU86_05405 [Phycisphaerales bacterium]